jgi:acetolactate synthase-1/3 small subunit
MLKVEVDPKGARQVVECVRRHRAAVLDETATTRTLQLTGTGAEVNEFLEEIGGIARIIELVRSGTAALECGAGALSTPV